MFKRPDDRDLDIAHSVLQKQHLMNAPFFPSWASRNMFLFSMIGAVSNRIARGAIPFPLDDCRCSYCLRCHPDDTTLKKCSKCRKVYYCNKECQKKHWKFHKQDCGTATEHWILDESLPNVMHSSDDESGNDGKRAEA